MSSMTIYIGILRELEERLRSSLAGRVDPGVIARLVREDRDRRRDMC
ncbi:MAG: hypothetical protein QW370_01120 [Ignisphaera sp.]